MASQKNRFPQAGGRCLLFFIAAGTMLLSGPGCAVTKGYSGGERNAAELATIYFYSGPGIQAEWQKVDGVKKSYFDLGIAVLPGRREFETEYSFEEPICEDKSFPCGSFAYTGHCTGTIDVVAGRSYAIRTMPSGHSPLVTVTDEASGEYAGHGSCGVVGLDYRSSDHKR